MSGLRIIETATFRLDLKTRMPFRYGIATVTHLPHLFVRVLLEVDGKRWHGVAADHLAPKWFTKNPETTPEADIEELLRVVRFAQDEARGKQADTPFALWQDLYRAQAAWGEANQLAPLLTHFGVTLVERAMIDAFCRASSQPFHTLLRTGALGVQLSAVHPELAGLTPADLLPPAPRSRVFARHTVGLSDPLTESDVAANDEKDGLPRSLAAAIQAYGLKHFKLKIGGNSDQDAARLNEIVRVIAAHTPAPDWAFSIDGNESYRTIETFRAFWEQAQTFPVLRSALQAGRLLFVEQPLHRDIALSETVGDAFAAWPDRPPIIIDESDATLTSLPTALERGYAGTSHKNCKGVFKGIANACLLQQRRHLTPHLPALLSGEDLSTIGPVALPQDLAVQAALGVASIERNGQHYFAGLSMFPCDIQEAVLAAHPDLYRRVPGHDYPTLAIANGEIELDTVNAAPFGIGWEFDPAR